MQERLRQCIPHFVLLLVSIALYLAAMQIDTGGTAGGRRIGPDFWPKVVIVFMGALALYEVVKRAIFGSDTKSTGLTADLQAGPPGDPSAPAAVDTAPKEHPLLLIGGSLLILCYVATVDVFGFFLTTALFLFSFAWVGGFRRYGWNALIALGGAFLMVVLFMRVAYISLPLGEGVFRSFSIALLSAIGVH